MSSTISKQELEHLAKLARIELEPGEEEKLLRDLGNILDHFKELQALDTANVAPMAGGSDLKSVFREDAPDNDAGNVRQKTTNQGAGVEAFPEKKDGFLKIPPVFE
jgi:aspartyl-tRNA(Asn)/glutamyl-tRNA(Gln) amidotransferase subunit C